MFSSGHPVPRLAFTWPWRPPGAVSAPDVGHENLSMPSERTPFVSPAVAPASRVVFGEFAFWVPGWAMGPWGGVGSDFGQSMGKSQIRNENEASDRNSLIFG